MKRRKRDLKEDFYGNQWKEVERAGEKGGKCCPSIRKELLGSGKNGEGRREWGFFPEFWGRNGKLQ